MCGFKSRMVWIEEVPLESPWCRKMRISPFREKNLMDKIFHVLTIQVFLQAINFSAPSNLKLFFLKLRDSEGIVRIKATLERCVNRLEMLAV